MAAPSFRQFARSKAVASTTNVRLDGYKAKLQGAPATLTPQGVYALLAEQPEGDSGPIPVTFKAKAATLDGTDNADADTAADNYALLPSDVLEYLASRYPGCDGSKGSSKGSKGSSKVEQRAAAPPPVLPNGQPV